MTMRRTLVLAGLAVALVSLSACDRKNSGQQPGAASAPQHNPGQADQREFAISLYTDPQSGLCFADFAAATLWKSKNQKVIWFPDDYTYQVDFGSNSPFGTNPIRVPYDPSNPNKGSPSGPLNSNASGEYKYTIVGNSCRGPGDPVIYVK